MLPADVCLLQLNILCHGRYHKPGAIQNDIIFVYITLSNITCQVILRHLACVQHYRRLHYQYWLLRVLIHTVCLEYINTQPKKWWMWNIISYWCGEFFFTMEFWTFWAFLRFENWHRIRTCYWGKEVSKMDRWLM